MTMQGIIKYLWPKNILLLQALDVLELGSNDFWIKKDQSYLPKRAMNYSLHKLIGRIVEIYIDDVVAESKSYKEHLSYLRETLECMQKNGLTMNTNKCASECQLDNFWDLLFMKGNRSRTEKHKGYQ